MGFRKILAVFLIMGALLVAFKEFFVIIVGICIILFIMIVIIRLLADVYWWGNDKGKWR